MMVGDGMEVLVKRAVPEIADNDQAIQDLIQEYRREYAITYKRRSRPYDGILEMLARLKESGLKLAVLSNKSHEFTVRLTRELLPFKFDVILGAKPGTPVKPDPTPLHQVLKELGLKPSEMVYVGDTSVDMETARAGGLLAVGALWGFRDAEELLRSVLRYCLKLP